MQRGSVSLPSRPPNDMGIGETLYAYVHIRRIWSPHFCITKIKPGRNVCTNFHVDLHVHNCFVNGRVVPYNGKFVTFRKNENFYHFYHACHGEKEKECTAIYKPWWIETNQSKNLNLIDFTRNLQASQFTVCSAFGTWML